MQRFARLSLLLVCAMAPVRASTVIMRSPAGATSNGYPVNVEATFTTAGPVGGDSRGTITITLINYLVNPTSISQALSGIMFLPNSRVTFASVDKTYPTLITVPEDPTHQTPAVSTQDTAGSGWKLALSSGSFQLGGQSGGYNQYWPSHMLLGDPGPNNIYTNADATLQNAAYNPFIRRTVQFTLRGYGITNSMTITQAYFFLGAGAEGLYGYAVPEPGTFSLAGLCVAAAVAIRRRRKLA